MLLLVGYIVDRFFFLLFVLIFLGLIVVYHFGFDFLAVFIGGVFFCIDGLYFEAFGKCHVLSVKVFEEDVVGHLFAELVVL